MPIVLSSRGLRSRWSAARLAASLAQSYAAVGDGPPESHRVAIIGHVDRIIHRLASQHGDAPAVSWPRSSVAEAVIHEIEARAPLAVAEHWRMRHPRWDTGAAETTETGPVWSYPLFRPAGAIPATGGSGSGRERRRSLARRGDWFAFWSWLADTQAEGAFDIARLFRQAGRRGQRSLHLTPEGWWAWWRSCLQTVLQDDPRIARLWAAAERWRSHCAVTGRVWMDHPLLPGGPGAAEGLDEDAWRLALITHLTERSHVPRPIALAVAERVSPHDDHWIPLAGLLALRGQGSLWRISGDDRDDWSPGAVHEPPVWAWSRLAAVVATTQPDALDVILSALRGGVLHPGSAWLREAGRPDPRWADDRSLIAHDDLDDILRRILTMVVETRWDGTATLDLARVRGRGALIGGRRPSGGLVPFLDVLDTALAVQGRGGADSAPITVIIPAWHPDVLAVLQRMHARGGRWRLAVSVPHRLMRAVLAGGAFHLLDPVVFPDADRLDDDAAVAAAVAQRDPRGHHHSTRSARSVLRTLLTTLALTGGSILWPDDLRQQAPGVAGLEGYGWFALPEGRSDATWVQMAVNAHRWVGPHATVRADVQRQAAQAVAALLSHAQHPAAAIGATGWREAMEEIPAEERDAWLRRAGQGWQHALTVACGSPDQPPETLAGRLDRWARSRGGGLEGRVHTGWTTTPGDPFPFSGMTLLAPFFSASCIFGVTEGDFPAFASHVTVFDDAGTPIHCPTRRLLSWADGVADPGPGWRACCRTRAAPDGIPSWRWRERLIAAGLVRATSDRGGGMSIDATEDLDAIAMAAWLHGLSVLRVRPPPRADVDPGAGGDADTVPGSPPEAAAPVAGDPSAPSPLPVALPEDAVGRPMTVDNAASVR